MDDPIAITSSPSTAAASPGARAETSSSTSNQHRVDDSVLLSSEIESFSLQNVKLVVMSACETGLGQAAGGEGLIGLQRAFHIAGADSVVASLWKVEDKPTQILMTKFYENLLVKKQGRLDSLRNAQLGC